MPTPPFSQVLSNCPDIHTTDKTPTFLWANPSIPEYLSIYIQNLSVAPFHFEFSFFFFSFSFFLGYFVSMDVGSWGAIRLSTSLWWLFLFLGIFVLFFLAFLLLVWLFCEHFFIIPWILGIRCYDFQRFIFLFFTFFSLFGYVLFCSFIFF